jgi:hypothetical protein
MSEQDSHLQTGQPDEPMPTEEERQAQAQRDLEQAEGDRQVAEEQAANPGETVEPQVYEPQAEGTVQESSGDEGVESGAE